MDWVRHPSYQRAKTSLVGRLKENALKLQRIRPVVFLCGQANSPNRDDIAEYLSKHQPQKLIFYADSVWAYLSKHNDNALRMERYLADLADMVLIVVESPGTFAELGAFSIVDELRKKLCLILDEQYQGAASFLETGPIAWVNQDSLFKPAIYANKQQVLKVASEIENRLRRIKRPASAALERGDKLQPRHRLCVLLDVVSIVGPASKDHIGELVAEVVGDSADDELETLLGLGVALRRIDRKEIDGAALYHPKLVDGRLPGHLKKKHFNVQDERAAILSVLSTIPAAMDALEQCDVTC